MTKKLSGKVALVTGGSRGIGAASARALADEGANVAISYVASPDKAEAVVAELKAKGGFPYPANQTPWQELYRSTVGQQATGACMELATRYQDIAGRVGTARDNH